MTRRMLMPQIRDGPEVYRSDLNGIAIPTVQPPSKRAVRTERVGIEQKAIAPIVVGIEDHAERVVLAQLIRVAAKLVADPAFRRRQVPAAGGDVNIVAWSWGRRSARWGREPAHHHRPLLSTCAEPISRLQEIGQRASAIKAEAGVAGDE